MIRRSKQAIWTLDSRCGSLRLRAGTLTKAVRTHLLAPFLLPTVQIQPSWTQKQVCLIDASAATKHMHVLARLQRVCAQERSRLHISLAPRPCLWPPQDSHRHSSHGTKKYRAIRGSPSCRTLGRCRCIARQLSKHINK